MTRILVTSDTHIDVSYPPAIARPRNKEFLQIFEQIIDMAINENVQAVCHAGDLFNNPAPAPVEVRGVVDNLQKLGHHGIPFYCIRGNHEGSADLETLFKGWAAEYVGAASMTHVHLIDPRFDKARGISTPGFRDLPGSIRIYGIGNFHNSTGEVLKSAIDVANVDQDKYNMLLLHAYIRDINNDHAFSKSEKPVLVSDITGLNIDLVAVGHSHHRVEPKKIDNTTFFSPGSPVDWRFDHCGSHGVYLVDIDVTSRDVSFTWKEIATRYFMGTLNVDGGAQARAKSWFEKQLTTCLASIKNETTKPLILNAIFNGSYEPGTPRLDPNNIRRFIQTTLGDQLFYLGNVSTKGVNYEVKKSVDIQAIRDAKMDEDHILEFLKSEKVETDLAIKLVQLYKDIDEAYTNPENLTDKKKELKANVAARLGSTIENEIRAFYASRITEKELDAITFTIQEPGKPQAQRLNTKRPAIPESMVLDNTLNKPGQKKLL